MKIRTRECFIQKIVDETSKHYEEDFYEQFDLVICGLDNLEARQWMSDKLISQVKPTLGNNGRSVILNTSTVVPMIDGGTEGYYHYYYYYYYFRKQAVDVNTTAIRF